MTAVEVVRFASEELEVELLPGLGARLHRLRAFGTDLLRTPPDPATHADDPFFWGSYVMAPWTNRAGASRVTVAGRTVDLAKNFADGTAIHGQVFVAPWERIGPTSFAVEHEGEGWPWAYEVTLDVGLEGPLLGLTFQLVNRSDAPMPGGIGLHPWWVRPVEVALHGRAVHPCNGDPDAEPVEAAGAWALDGPVRLGLDATWLDVAPPEVHLAWPDTGLRATLTAAAEGPMHVAVATPDDPDATAIEPVTHVPWALDLLAHGRSSDLRVIEPGGSLLLDIRFDVRHAF